jgi:hypothetical protein
MITWKIVVDDYGDCVSVTEIAWPNTKYHSILVQSYHRR